MRNLPEENKEYSFYAMLDRMQYINRWGLMRNNRTENLKEHSMDVAIVAHALATIHNRIYPETGPLVDTHYVMGIALLHDASEIITGDMPTPIKYFSPEITRAYKEIEGEATDRLLDMLPEELRSDYAELFHPDRDIPANALAYRLVKAADRLCAYIKCVTEENSGNKEFVQARVSIERSIRALALPEADYFMEHFMPAYGMTLDRISE